MTKGTCERKWVLVNLEGKVIGRAATEIAAMLRGKDTANFTPNLDNGKFVVAINAEKVKFTGNKLKDKIYYRHSGYFGGLKERTAEERLKKDPEQLIVDTVKCMMPRGKLTKQLLTKLKVYRGSEHPHISQKPEIHNLKG